MRIAGLINVEAVERRFDERFNSSKYLSSFISSGRVTKLLPYRSRVLSLGMLYKYLILAGVSWL